MENVQQLEELERQEREMVDKLNETNQTGQTFAQLGANQRQPVAPVRYRAPNAPQTRQYGQSANKSMNQGNLLDDFDFNEQVSFDRSIHVISATAKKP